MNSLGKKKILRIYIDSEDKYNKKPLWEEILKKVKEEQIAGATVFKAIAGMGPKAHLRAFNVFVLSEELPIVIEIIDTQEKIEKFVITLDDMIEEGLVTITDTEVIQYKHKDDK
jgi:PII-like signaling protein